MNHFWKIKTLYSVHCRPAILFTPRIDPYKSQLPGGADRKTKIRRVVVAIVADGRTRILHQLEWYINVVTIDRYDIDIIPVGGEYTGLRSRRRKIRDDTWFHLVEIRVFIIKRETEQPDTQARRVCRCRNVITWID